MENACMARSARPEGLFTRFYANGKCCGQYYLGKTQRCLKKRCQEHYQAVGIFWSKKKRVVDRLNDPLPSSVASFQFNNDDSASRVSTRSMTRRRAQTPNRTPTPATPSGMDYLISLFSPLNHENNNIPPTINEGEVAEEVDSDLESTTFQLPLQLTLLTLPTTQPTTLPLNNLMKPNQSNLTTVSTLLLAPNQAYLPMLLLHKHSVEKGYWPNYAN